MRDEQAKSGSGRQDSSELPPGRAWRTLHEEVERELDAWIERRRRRQARRAFLPDARPEADGALVQAHDN